MSLESQIELKYTVGIIFISVLLPVTVGVFFLAGYTKIAIVLLCVNQVSLILKVYQLSGKGLIEKEEVELENKRLVNKIQTCINDNELVRTAHNELVQYIATCFTQAEVDTSGKVKINDLKLN